MICICWHVYINTVFWLNDMLNFDLSMFAIYIINSIQYLRKPAIVVLEYHTGANFFIILNNKIYHLENMNTLANHPFFQIQQFVCFSTMIWKLITFIMLFKGKFLHKTVRCGNRSFLQTNCTKLMLGIW